MKAVRIHQHGDIDQLRYEEAPEPQVSPDEVVIRVRASALNHSDVWARTGQGYRNIPMPHILGADVAGTVEAMGQAVKGITMGSQVVVSPGISCGTCQFCLSGDDNMCPSYIILGTMVDGGNAEFVKVPAINVLPMPQGLSFEEAAAVPLVFLTAWHMLVTKAQVKPGDDVLVHAAGSGVGSAAIQIAKLFGARVITTASRDEKLEKARGLGADVTVNYASSDFSQEVRKVVGRKGAEIVIDSVGADVLEKSIPLLATNGRLVTCGATAGPTATVDIRYIFIRNLAILGTYMGSKAELITVLKFFPTGQLKPVVHRVLPLQEAAEAHRIMDDRENFGKIVLSV